MYSLGSLEWPDNPMEQNSPNTRFARNVIIKATLLFLLANLLFTFGNPMPLLGRLSAYNHLFPGRVRLPYGEKPAEAYNLSLFNLEAMFAAHELTADPKPFDEYRVLIVGDSSVWGFLLEPENTLSAYINAKQLTAPDGQTIHAHNLGYPTMSLTKDVLILSQAIEYEPDLILWLVTLESFPVDKQLDSPILQHNPESVRNLIAAHTLPLDPNSPSFVESSIWGTTIIGQRRALADIFRLQLYGVMWAGTGVDQFYPARYDPPQENLEPDETFHGSKPPQLNANDLAIDVLEAGVSIAGDVPVIIINEPMYISQGENSQIRYNFFYPRWAYDQYRQLMTEFSLEKGWNYIDFWNLVPASEYTNSAIHLTPAGSAMLAEQIGEALLEFFEE